MKGKDVLRAVGGAAMVYVVMAACGAGEREAASGRRDAGGLLDAVAEGADGALTHPVGDAKADPLGPVVTTTTCNKSGSIGGSAQWFAVGEFPGRSVQELSTVRALIDLAPAGRSYAEVDGHAFAHHTAAVLGVRPGVVAVACTQNSTVTFVLPR